MILGLARAEEEKVAAPVAAWLTGIDYAQAIGNIPNFRRAARAASINDITYYVYTRLNTNPDVIPASGFRSAILESHFKLTLPTFFLTHGYFGDINSTMNVLVRTPILQYHNVNVIFVDWSPAAKDPLYQNAKDATVPIGNLVGNDINYLTDNLGYPSSWVSLAGFSLGAHLFGATGARTGGTVHQIFGLDPARPLYENANASTRLDKTDARFVEVIHTNGDGIGLNDAIGHADYYPNGGKNQPGCGLNFGCSHSRSVAYFAESLDICKRFPARRCDSYENYLSGGCRGNHRSYLGGFEADVEA